MLNNKRKREESVTENAGYFAQFSSFARRLSPRQNVEKVISLSTKTVVTEIANILKKSAINFRSIEKTEKGLTLQATYGMGWSSYGGSFKIDLTAMDDNTTKVEISTSPRIPTVQVDFGHTARQIDEIFAHLQKTTEANTENKEVEELPVENEAKKQKVSL